MGHPVYQNNTQHRYLHRRKDLLAPQIFVAHITFNAQCNFFTNVDPAFRLMSFLNKSNFLCSGQYGFRAASDTTMAFSNIQMHIGKKEACEQHWYTWNCTRTIEKLP